MPGWNDLGTAFNTLREIDVTAIREESERPVTVACVGPRPLFHEIYALLRNVGNDRYGFAGRDPFVHQPLPTREPDEQLRRADLLLILLDGREPLSSAGTSALVRLGQLALPTVIAVCGVTSPGDLGRPRPEFAQAHIVVIPDLAAPEARRTLAEAMLARLPGELQLAAARSIPGLRSTYAEELVGSVSLTNATYSLASAIPEQIPILAVPFAAADIIVLTKNQALMVYRLALAHGAPPEFQARMGEIAPVIGSAFVWRQVARTLVGLIPFWGVVPKVTIAYAGTFTVGTAAWRWFTDGELLSRERMKQIADEAMRVGSERARALVDAMRERRESSKPDNKGKTRIGSGKKP